jgi:zinc transporter ZupT
MRYFVCFIPKWRFAFEMCHSRRNPKYKTTGRKVFLQVRISRLSLVLTFHSFSDGLHIAVSGNVHLGNLPRIPDA